MSEKLERRWKARMQLKIDMLQEEINAAHPRSSQFYAMIKGLKDALFAYEDEKLKLQQLKEGKE